MISTILAFALAGAGMQPVDTARPAREAFNACLRTYVQHSIETHVTMEAFNAAFAQQCTAEEAAYRGAIVQREVSMHSTRAQADQAATDQIEEARGNFHERFEMAVTPQAQ